MARKGRIRENRTVDSSTGEVLTEVSTVTYAIEDEPPYIKLYIADVLYLCDMPRRYEALTLALLKRVSYAGGEQGLCVSVNKFVKESICKEIGWENIVSVDNALQVLMKGEVIFRIARGVYRFNPYLFGRGNWAEVKKLRMEINYDSIKGRTFMTNVDYKEDERKYWVNVNKED